VNVLAPDGDKRCGGVGEAPESEVDMFSF